MPNRDGNNGHRNELRRPLLAGGERLREDTTRVRGSGEKSAPYSLETAWQTLKPQAAALRAGLEHLDPQLCGRHIIIEATLLPNYLASSWFPTELLSRADLYPVGTRPAKGTYRTEKRVAEDVPTKTLLLAGTRESIRNLALFAENRPSTQNSALWEQLREFAGFALPAPKRVVKSMPRDAGEGEIVVWEAVVSPIGRTPSEQREFADEALVKLAVHIERLGGEVRGRYRRMVRGVTFVPVLLNQEAVMEAAQFNLLRALRPMPRIRPLLTSPLRAAHPQDPSPPPSGAKPASDLRIATFDGGIDPSNPYFAPFAVAHSLTSEPPDPSYTDHGSLVTSALLYGPLEPGEPLPQPPAFVDHYRVIPLPKSEEEDFKLYWILDRIVETVKIKGHKLVSLSLGPDVAVKDDSEPDRWTAELDALAEEHGVTFVAAVGNNGANDAELGLNRIQAPSDMVNGIGVGACSSKPNEARFKRAWYSAVGPGRAGQRVQPVGVVFGGCKASGNPFIGFDTRGRLAGDEGTSFAAPAAMKGLAELSADLGARSSPACLRAFAVHFAQRLKRGHKEEETGAGRLPLSYVPLWECRANEVTLLYQDKLARGEAVAMHLPYPNNLPVDVRIQVRWTIAYTSKVDPADCADYTLSGLDLVFRPHERRRSVVNSFTKQPIAQLDQLLDAKEFERLASQQPIQWSQNPVADSQWRKGGRTEADLRDAGKWQTICRGGLSRPVSDLFRPRLDLTYLSREKGVLVASEEPMDVTMLVTLIAPPSVALYDMVRADYPILVPIHHTIAIRASSGT